MASKNEEKEKKVITLDTMLKMGKKGNIANREYVVCPINIEDMPIFINGELFVPDKDKLEKGEIRNEFFGINIVDEQKSKTFFYVVEKYARYENQPVTRDMIIEHNWSFSDIKKFLYTWLEISE